jgi:hypothetical protein
MDGNLVRLSKWVDPMFSRSTLYKWRHLRKFPRLFTKIGGAVFIDRAVLAEIAEAGRIN